MKRKTIILSCTILLMMLFLPITVVNGKEMCQRNVVPSHRAVRLGDTMLLSSKATQKNIDLDLVITIPGDINADGNLNIGDVAKTYAHVRGTKQLTDPYQLKCADFTGDNRLNLGDVARAYAKVKMSYAM